MKIDPFYMMLQLEEPDVMMQKAEWIGACMQGVCRTLSESSGGPYRACGSVLRRIRDLFEQEEVLMIKAGYHDCELQIRAHQTFWGQYGYGSCLLAEAEAGLASDWLKQHEQCEDAVFRKFLKKRMRKSSVDLLKVEPDRIFSAEKYIF